MLNAALRLTLILFVASACAQAGWLEARASQLDDADGLAFYEKRIRPVLSEHCGKCHGAETRKPKGNLSLATAAGWLSGGDSGPAVVPGDPEKSLLIKAVRHQDGDLRMPPDKALPDDTVADLVAWVRRGAPAPRGGASSVRPKPAIATARQNWPYTAVPREIPLPAAQATHWPKTTVDYFILGRLEQHALSPAPDTDKRTLLRRISFDLTGLPPTPEEIESFARDNRPDALARVVDRLLASPAYGERWGRHWLDVVRYADTAGDNSDYPIPQMYLYRNWVINAFASDLPFDEMIRDQLAGDLRGSASESEKHERLIATGYIANARRFGSRVDDYPQHLTIEDTLDNLGRTFLGLTVSCARCHDHKFDPIAIEDYYALYGIFHSTRYPWPGIELEKRQRDFAPLVPVEYAEATLKMRADALAEITAEIKKLEKVAAMAKKGGKDKDRGLEKQIEAKKKEKDRLLQAALPFPTAYAVADAKRLEDAPVQLKGDPEKPGARVSRRFLAVLGGQQVPDGGKTSGRLALANWIAAPDNPLTARVMANRIWHYHFGRGLVATPNDFGKQGQPPSHPELLDYLARRFIESGWSVKLLHREIVLSRTYQMATAQSPSDKIRQLDPGNRFLWSFPRRRLDAESIRDALLAVSGKLDRSRGGAHPFPDPATWDFTQHKPFRAVYETNRRSVYLMTQRIQRHPYLAIFDGPDTAASTAARVTSTTTLQSLYFLNDAFFHEQARHFASRVRAERITDSDRVNLAFLMAFGRQPDLTEQAAALGYLKSAPFQGNGGREKAWESLARVMLRANEFVYLD